MSFAIATAGDAAKGPITFRSQPGETAVLDGGCLTPSEGHGALIELHNVSYATIEGFEGRNYKTSDPKRTPAGLCGEYHLQDTSFAERGERVSP